jgi:hypothetical protein
MFALEEMNSAKWVDDCCAQAIFVSNGMGVVEAATSKRTVAGWNILLQANREHFPQPDPTIHKHKKPLPDLLEYFREEIISPCTDYCIGNLADLTVEMARNELVTKIVPGCNIFNRLGLSSPNRHFMRPNSLDRNDTHHSDLLRYIRLKLLIVFNPRLSGG